MKRRALVLALSAMAVAWPASAPRAAEDPLIAVIKRLAGENAPGAAQVGNFFRGSDEKTDWHIEMEVGKCYWIIGAGGGKIEELSLYLWDPADERVTQNTDSKTNSTIVHCPPDPGMYKFQAKASEGSGPYVVGVFAKPGTPYPRKKGGGLGGLWGKIKGTPKEEIKCDGGKLACDGKCVDVQSDMKHCGKCGNDCKTNDEVCREGKCVDSTDIDGIIAAEAKAIAPGYKRVGEIFHGEGKMQDWYTEMRQGKCYHLIGAGGREMKKLFLYLWGPDNKRITENRNGNRKVDLAYCATADGMYKFQAKVDSGGGPYAVGVFAK